MRMGLGAESVPGRFFRKTAVLLDGADIEKGREGIGRSVWGLVRNREKSV